MKFEINKIKKILCCAESVPFYRNLYKKAGIDIRKISSYDEFCQLPLLNKITYRNELFSFFPDKFAEKIDINVLKNGTFREIDSMLASIKCNMVITSGSTGVPLKVIHSDADDHRAYSIMNNFRKKYLGQQIFDKYLWVLPMNDRTKEYFYDSNVNYIQNTYGIDYFLANYTKKNLEKLHQLVLNMKPSWISCSPSMLFEYAKFLYENNYKYDFSYIELHSEPLYDWQYETIRKSFDGVLKLVYSSNEVNFIGTMCSNGLYRILTDNVFVELLDTDVSSEFKKVIVTSLSYYDFPIIRYELGDLARQRIDNCGNSFIELCKFRDADMIVSDSGELCEPYIVFDSVVFLCEKYNVCINKYTIIQKKVNLFEYHFSQVEAIPINSIKMFLEQFLKTALGYYVTVNIKRIDDRTFNKYRRFICNVN